MHEEDEVARRQVDLDKVDGAAGAARELAFQIERADGLGVEERRHEREIEFSAHHADAVLRRNPPATAAATASAAPPAPSDERIW